MKIFFNVWEDEITFVARAEDPELDIIGDMWDSIKKGEEYIGLDFEIWQAFHHGMVRINYKFNKIIFM